ncbi:MAG: hypothetical protein B7Y95_01495 [Rhizobiales bacterium 32-66-11]|jgi:hypothetical protein|nr:MAG: hypothetical protein B7Y95_01495 [Rhizobiales bacterium 32-66-11]
MSEFREFAVLENGVSSADPEALARAVRNHKAGDALAQVALTIALMLAICAVTVVLSFDRASASVLNAAEATMSSSILSSSLLSLSLFGLLALAGAAMLTRMRVARLQPVRVRASRPRLPR